MELFAGIGKEEDELARIFDGSLSLSLLLILSTNIAAEFTLDGGRLLVGAIFVLDFTIDLSSNLVEPSGDLLLKSFIFGSSFNCIIGIDVVVPILLFGGFFGGCIGI